MFVIKQSFQKFDQIDLFIGENAFSSISKLKKWINFEKVKFPPMKKIYTIILLLTISCGLKAAIFTSIATGDWQAPGTWSFVGISASGIPTNADDVTIAASNTVTLTATASAKNLITNSTGLLKMNLHTILVYGNLTNNGNVTGSGSILFHAVGTFSGTNMLTINGSFYFYYDYTISAGCILSVTGSIVISSGANVINNGSMAATSTVNMLGASSSFTNGPGAVIWFGTSLSLLGTLNASAVNNTVVYYNSASSNIRATTYYNLLLGNKTSACSRKLIGNIIVLKNLTIGNNNTFNWNNFNITLGGNWINNANTTCTNMGTVTFNGAGTQTISRTSRQAQSRPGRP